MKYVFTSNTLFCHIYVQMTYLWLNILKCIQFITISELYTNYNALIFVFTLFKTNFWAACIKPPSHTLALEQVLAYEQDFINIINMTSTNATHDGSDIKLPALNLKIYL